MLYKKPSNLKYTDMCIYIDNHVYTDDCDEVLVFQYLYFLIGMLARQASYFINQDYYEDFAVQSASRVFMRLRNPRQFEYNDDGTPKLERVKSVLNYVRSTLYPMKVMFERDNYQQTTLQDPDKTAIESPLIFGQQISESIDKMALIDFDLYLHDINKTCKRYLQRIPKKKNSCEWLNIYTSCILTFLNQVTLSNKNKERVKMLGEAINESPQILNAIYKEERKDGVILYHLGEEFHDYIYVLVNKMRHLVARDLSSTIHTFLPSEISAKGLLMASIEDFDNDEQT